jgi:copper transport protein
MRFWSRVVATMAVAAVVVVIGSPLALAHVDLAGSTPSEGAELTDPVSSIELVFTEASQPAGDGIRLLVAPDTPVDASITQQTDSVILIAPAEPLTEGVYAVGWTVQAGDAHPRSGSFTFTVVAEEPIAAPSAPEVTIPIPAVGAEPDTAEDEPFASLGTEPNTAVADWLGRVARWLGLSGALVGIGALVFGTSVPMRSVSEARRIAFWVRRAGLMLLIAVPLELFAQAALLNGGSLLDGFRLDVFASILGGPLGWSLLLRGGGGAGLLWGTGLDTATAQRPGPGESEASGSLGNGITQVAAVTRPRYLLDASASAMAGVGVLAVLGSYLFDGHTVTASPALVVKLADLVHVGAAAVWVGGVIMLALTLSRRRADGQSLEAAELVLRFSSLATVALAAVGIAGVVLAWSILDSVGELFSTAWGRVLLAKLTVVGAAAAVGGYNHFVVLPALAAAEGNAASDLIRRTSLMEAALLVGVVALTAILVGSAS